MYHDIISVGLIGGMFYLANITAAKAENVKSYVNINSLFRIIFGFFIFRGTRFSTKSVVGQALNVLAILVAVVAFFAGYEDTLGLFITIEVVNVFVMFVVSLFVNR